MTRAEFGLSRDFSPREMESNLIFISSKIMKLTMLTKKRLICSPAMMNQLKLQFE